MTADDELAKAPSEGPQKEGEMDILQPRESVRREMESKVKTDRQTDRNGDRRRKADKRREGETEVRFAGTSTGSTYCASSGAREPGQS